MNQSVIEERIILAIFIAFTGVFVWYVRDGAMFDLVFIIPLTVVIAVLCGIVALQSFRAPAAEHTNSESDDQVTKATSQKGRIFAFLMLLLLIGLNTVGFFTSLTLFLVSSLWVLGNREWKVLVFVPLILISFIYLAFSKLLGVPFDISPLGLY